MLWKTVQKFAADNKLELYTPLCGYHKQLQIIDLAAGRHWRTANKAKAVYQSLLCIVHQKALAVIPTHEIIMQANDIHSDLY